jgi:signal transduction histidine kinase
MNSTFSETARQPVAGGFDARSEIIAQQAREDERRRIARDLHDDVSQQLALLTISLDLLRQHPAALNPDMRQRLDTVLAQVQSIGSSVRHVSHQLHASALNDLGAAVQRLCHQFAAYYDINIQVISDRIPASMPNALALALYRIIQQALLNVVKHSGARHTTVEIEGRAEDVLVRIEDDGRGFDVATLKNHGLGLVSMRERVEPFDGQLSIVSTPSDGTCIEVSVPLCLAAGAAA